MKTEKTYATFEEDETVNTGGTYLVGEITATYQDLVKHFGAPSESDEYKSDAEWNIRFKDDNSVASIYNWKDGKNYLGKNGTPTTKITDWHIGGINHKVVERIEEILKTK